jgi:hypothetical protein
MNIRYKIFQFKTNLNLVFRIFKSNREWDYGHFVKFQILKLTSMGIYFNKHSFIDSEEKKNIVRSIWKARKHLSNFINSSEILGLKAEKEILKRIGKPYKLVIKYNNDKESPNSIISIENYSLEEENIANLMYKSIAGLEIESEYQEAELRKAFEIIKDNIRNWWD